MFLSLFGKKEIVSRTSTTSSRFNVKERISLVELSKKDMERIHRSIKALTTYEEPFVTLKT